MSGIDIKKRGNEHDEEEEEEKKASGGSKDFIYICQSEKWKSHAYVYTVEEVFPRLALSAER